MKKILFMLVVASAFTIAVSVGAAGFCGRGYTDKNNDGVCDYFNSENRGRRFLDTNGDGVCDYCTGNLGNCTCNNSQSRCGLGCGKRQVSRYNGF